ncbi:MAG: FAD-dependent oxidoreductase, partial [Myxococcota bacterium]|nr:FAD-dependent oxidoreductase [Myxococcota bacterium]
MVVDLPSPDRVDVAVLGGGLAGLTLADRLADSANVLVVGGQAAPAAASERGIGIVACGGADSPARLAQALGEHQAQALWAWSRRATSELARLAQKLGVSWEACGSSRLALRPLEAEEWAQSSTLIRSWEGEDRCRPLAAEDIQNLGYRGFVGGAWVEGDGKVDLPALLAALGASLQDRAVLAPGPARVIGIDDEGVRISMGSRQITSELVVVAGGAASGRIHPWFNEIVYPVRLQGLRTAPVGLSSLTAPALARHRFEAWHQEDDGSISF